MSTPSSTAQRWLLAHAAVPSALIPAWSTSPGHSMHTRLPWRSRSGACPPPASTRVKVRGCTACTAASCAVALSEVSASPPCTKKPALARTSCSRTASIPCSARQSSASTYMPAAALGSQPHAARKRTSRMSEANSGESGAPPPPAASASSRRQRMYASASSWVGPNSANAQPALSASSSSVVKLGHGTSGAGAAGGGAASAIDGDRGDRGDRGEPTSGGARSWETELSERRELWEQDLCRGETPSGGELCSAPVPESEWPTAFSAEAAASAAAGP